MVDVERKPLDRVVVRVPASTANLGPGFDCLGLALNLYNRFDLERIGGRKVIVEAAGPAASGLPQNRKNLVWRAAARVLRATGEPAEGYRLKIECRVPLARGLGSSATAIIGGMVAANALARHPLGEDDLLREIIALEGHPDNVGASFYGGLTAACTVGRSRHRFLRFQPHRRIRVILAVPDYTLSTRSARAALPAEVPHGDAVFNLCRIPFIVERFCTGETDDLTELVADRLHEPYRRRLVRGYDAIRKSALDAGAAAVALSGAGPTLVAFTTGDPGPIERAVGEAMEKAGVGGSVLVCRPDRGGTKVLQAS